MKSRELNVNEEYLEWMYQLVQAMPNNVDVYGKSYKLLFEYLYEIKYEYSILMDGNRAEDGVSLRYHFGYVKRYNQKTIERYLDTKPCSVLEMIVALAFRCEEHIMSDPLYGDRTSVWFWEMIRNLGLESMNDENFDPNFVKNVIYNFMNHNYKRNGEGGLFTVENSKYDMRTVEIWWQMSWYLNSIL